MIYNIVPFDYTAAIAEGFIAGWRGTQRKNIICGEYPPMPERSTNVKTKTEEEYIAMCREGERLIANDLAKMADEQFFISAWNYYLETDDCPKTPERFLERIERDTELRNKIAAPLFIEW